MGGGEMNAVIIVDIFAAAIAVIGIICFSKYLSDTVFLPREVVTVITILNDQARANADILIHILKNGIWKCGKRQTCVMISERYRDDEVLLEMIRTAGLEYHVVKDQ